MYWENPWVLSGVGVLLPVVAGLLVYAHLKRVAAARRFVDRAMVGRLMPQITGPRPWVKGILVLVGLALLIVAGARPRFGVYFEKVSQRGVDVFVLLDVSRSMTAEDVAPNRLERAKSDVRDLVERLAGDRVGLIAFAGKPVVTAPLTTDQGFFRMVLDEVDTGSAPRGGTLIGDAIRAALAAMPERRDRDQVIVLITDGEDHESYPEEAAKQAAARGVKIFAVGFGNAAEGARIPIRDEGGGLKYLKHQGQEVWSKVDDRLLKQVALDTGGVYFPVGTRAYDAGEDLGTIIQGRLAKLTRGEVQGEKRKRYREQFQLFVCLGVALLLVEMAIPAYRRPTIEIVSTEESA
jgi:Ca-activated chloride channel family protein